MKLRSLISLTIMSLSLFSCSQEQSNSLGVNEIVNGNIQFGENNRLTYKTTDNGRSFVGRLESNKSLCTASLVGRGIIVTAAHCMVDTETDEAYDHEYTFKLGYNKGKSVLTSRVSLITHNSEQDWALARVDKRLGNKVGHFGIKSISSDYELSDSDYLNTLRLTGYGVYYTDGQYNRTQIGCSIVDVEKDENGKVTSFDHDCDISGGDSGAPVYKCFKDKGCYILGVQSTHYLPSEDLEEFKEEGNLIVEDDNSSYRNVATAANNFIEVLAKILKEE